MGPQYAIFFDLEVVSAEGPGLVFGLGHHDGFQESSELLELVASKPNVQTMARIDQIRRLFR